VRSSEDNPKRVERPEVSKKQAPAIEASGGDVTALDYRLPEATEGNLDGNSVRLPADVRVDQEDLPEDLRNELDSSLDPGKQEIADVFSELGLPLSSERIPIGGTGKHHTAS
jgi:hypothetical protein